MTPGHQGLGCHGLRVVPDENEVTVYPSKNMVAIWLPRGH